jgi:ABC-type multidrug transport system fused ATPase/permease subunit
VGDALFADLQDRLFAHLAVMPLQYFSTIRSGATGTRMTTDANGTEALFTNVVVESLASLLTLAGPW